MRATWHFLAMTGVIAAAGIAVSYNSRARIYAAEAPGEHQYTVESVLRTDSFEREIEGQIWNSARELRQQREEIAFLLQCHRKELASAQQHGIDLPPARLAIQLQEATLVRIDNRLKALAGRRDSPHTPESQIEPPASLNR